MPGWEIPYCFEVAVGVGSRRRKAELSGSIRLLQEELWPHLYIAAADQSGDYKLAEASEPGDDGYMAGDALRGRNPSCCHAARIG